MRQVAQQVVRQFERDIAVPSMDSVIVTIAASLAGAFASIAAAYSRRQAIARLRQMDDRMLRDIGIRREDIVAAVNGEISRRR